MASNGWETIFGQINVSEWEIGKKIPLASEVSHKKVR